MVANSKNTYMFRMSEKYVYGKVDNIDWKPYSDGKPQS